MVYTAVNRLESIHERTLSIEGRMSNMESMHCHRKFGPLFKTKLCTANGSTHRPPDAEIFEDAVLFENIDTGDADSH